MTSHEGRELKEFNWIYRGMEEIYHKIALNIGISDSAFLILYNIQELGDGCLQKDICNMSFISKQTVSSSIHKLENQGLLYLKAGKGREMQIFLTENGKQFVNEKIQPVVNVENSVFQELSAEECREFLRLNEKYLKCFREKSKRLL